MIPTVAAYDVCVGRDGLVERIDETADIPFDPDQAGGLGVRLQRTVVFSGFDKPVAVAAPPKDQVHVFSITDLTGAPGR